MHMMTKSSLVLLFNKIALTIVAMLMAFWLSACSVTPSSTAVVQPEQTTSSAMNDAALSTKTDPFSYQACVYPPNEIVQACSAKGGAFSKQGRLGCYQCVVSYTDAGKTCQGSADCQGQCVNKDEFIAANVKNQSGQCASDSSLFGCYQTIEKGVAQSAICVD